jgi:phospholipase D1/2
LLVLNAGEALPEYWRVDNLLKRKAEEGVRIYILLWNEPLPFVNNFSREAENTLQALHPNIKVVRAARGGIFCF